MDSGIMGTGYSYDSLMRLIKVESEITVANREYVYLDLADNRTTMQVTKLHYPNLKGGFAFNYTYDVMGNIASYSSYDETAMTYTYGDSSWADLLTAYDGEAITYDAIGNPLSYYNGTRWTFTWGNGRRLETATDGTNSISYNYTADGTRTSKTVNGVVHTYYYSGTTLLRETYGDTILDFFYDANGTPIAMKQNNNIYYYITNLQGDVIRLVDSQGQTAAQYSYDPYGKAVYATGSHAEINPLRYRGYYYDCETGLYYLTSRYYDPEVGRFINLDKYLSTGQGILGYNVYAYCNNNPVLRFDPTGNLSIPASKNTEMKIIDAEGNSPWIEPPYTGNYGSWGTEGQKVVDVVEETLENEDVQNTYAVVKVGKGVKKVFKGFGTMLVPEPTVTAEILGGIGIVHGIYLIITGIIEIFD